MKQQPILDKHCKRENPPIHNKRCNPVFILDAVKAFLIILLLTGMNMSYCNAQITYRIKAKNFSADAINSYPQKVIAKEVKDGIHDITLQAYLVTFDSVASKFIKEDTINLNYPYSPELHRYLEPTELIDFKLPEVAAIADTLFKHEKNTYKTILKGLEFVSGYLTYDDSLALEIDKGNCFTLPVSVVLKTKKGTCGETTNLFISLMRFKGIPCRFITGYVFYPPLDAKDSHTWAECYVKGFGWLPVDPQSGQLAAPYEIKLFAGKDYKDCNVKLLGDIAPLSIEIIDNKCYNYK